MRSERRLDLSIERPVRFGVGNSRFEFLAPECRDPLGLVVGRKGQTELKLAGQKKKNLWLMGEVPLSRNLGTTNVDEMD